ncbi:MAG TPA: hypothetical protein VL490_08705 [Mucilaginibacter sp.]|jgi:hypothetical protein|nr:hypothetical protein [Mucilaginibacter sp.]
MKKLKLKLDGIKDMLTKEQMKKISGGYTGDGTPYNCSASGKVGCYCGGSFVQCVPDCSYCSQDFCGGHGVTQWPTC